MQDEKITSEIFSRTFCDLMEARGVSQPRLAGEIGIAQSAVFNYRNGRIPKALELLSISQFFGVTMEFMLTGQAGSGGGELRIPDAEEIRRQERARLAARLRKVVEELEG
jgi:transcriptional regulator with XRE-family HTH domain